MCFFPYVTILTFFLMFCAKISFRRFDKVKSIMHPSIWLSLISSVLFYYVMFCHPFQSFLYKNYLENIQVDHAFCIDSKYEDKSFEIFFNQSLDQSNPKVVIIEGYKSVERARILKQISSKYDNAIYYRIPIGTKNYTMKIAKNLGYFYLPNLLMSYFRNSNNIEDTLLFDYLDFFNFKINSKNYVSTRSTSIQPVR